MITFSPSDINIASQPFRRERAQNAITASIAAGLTVSLLGLVILILRSQTQAADLRSIINSQQAELTRIQSSQAQYSTILARPVNADVFAQSVLLNELIARRGVSWTRVFQDLGTVLPNNMRLLSIRLPQVAAENGTGRNRVQLDMWVGTEQPAAVIQFLKRLAGSRLFGDASVMTQTPPTQNNPLYQYRLTVSYAQRL
jgi:type IV pilus assembly protein PilN